MSASYVYFSLAPPVQVQLNSVKPISLRLEVSQIKGSLHPTLPYHSPVAVLLIVKGLETHSLLPLEIELTCELLFFFFSWKELSQFPNLQPDTWNRRVVFFRNTHLTQLFPDLTHHEKHLKHLGRQEKIWDPDMLLFINASRRAWQSVCIRTTVSSNPNSFYRRRRKESLSVLAGGLKSKPCLCFWDPLTTCQF